MTFLGPQSKEKKRSNIFMVLFSARTGLIFCKQRGVARVLKVLVTTSGHCLDGGKGLSL